jgi:hypothetical protein
MLPLSHSDGSDELVKTAEEVYVRLHGPLRWYRHATPT